MNWKEYCNRQGDEITDVVGVYETEEIKLLSHVKSPGNILELGACLGVVSVITNHEIVTGGDQVHTVVEANPDLIPYLMRNRRNNSCNFNIINGLVSKTSKGDFWSYDKIVAGSADRLDKREKNKTQHKVPVCQLEELSQTAFNTLIIDIEGEIWLLQFPCGGWIHHQTRKEYHGRAARVLDEQGVQR